MSSRPLPTPPISPGEGYWRNDYLDPGNELGSPYYPFHPFQSYGVTPTTQFSDHPTTLRGGTMLHKGFYDLLALIPSTPSPSRFFWPTRAPQDPEPVAGPRYEEIQCTPPKSLPVQAPSSPPPPLRKGRRISKDMVSKPTGFVYVLQNISGSSFTHTLSQPSCTRFRCRSGSCTPNPMGSGWSGQARWFVSEIFRWNTILTPSPRPALGKPNQEYDPAEQPSQGCERGCKCPQALGNE